MSTETNADATGVMPAKVSTREEASDQGGARDWKSAAVALWALLDDIDTADDAAKSDDAAFRRIAQRVQQRRFNILGGAEWNRARVETDVAATPCESIILDGSRTSHPREGE